MVVGSQNGSGGGSSIGVLVMETEMQMRKVMIKSVVMEIDGNGNSIGDVMVVEMCC